MKTQDNIRHGRSVVYALTAHLVFVTKYRRGVISDRVRVHLQESFESVMTDFGGALLQCDGEDDHIHLLVSYPPKYSVTNLVNALKGVSARLLRKRNLPEVRSKLWGAHLWTPSYFASSTGGASLDTVRQYIENQRVPRKRGPKGAVSSRP
jgi:putative transposase